MITKSDMTIFAIKLRSMRPNMADANNINFQPNHFYGSTDYDEAISQWKLYRNMIADCLQQSNWRFNRDLFFKETEK